MSASGPRVPLQVGLAALRNAVRANLLGWGGVFAFIVGGFVLPHYLPDVLADVSAAVCILGFSLVALIAFVYAWDAGELVKTEGPSDLVLAEDRLRIDGGPFHGRMILWSAIDPAGCEVVELPAERAGLRRLVVRAVTLGRSTVARRPVYALRLRTRGGETVELAHSDDPEEVDSLRELAATLAAIAADEAAPPAAPPATGPALLACQACAAPLAPADAAQVTCHHCRATVDVPAELRERMRAPEVAARAPAVQRRMQRMLSRPGWTRAAGWLRWGRRAIRLAWPVALVGFVVVSILHEHTGKLPVVKIVEGYPSTWRRDLLLAIGVVVAVIAVVSANVAAILASRRAVRVVSLRLGAIPPATAGAPSTCRQCGAPLPAVADQVIARCVYCAADNVVTSDLRVAARRTRGQSASLDEATRHRRRAAIRLAIVALLSAAAITALVREIRWSVRLAPPVEIGDMGCVFCTSADVKNDDHRRVIALDDGTHASHFTVPAGVRFRIECEHDCTMDIGTASVAVVGRYNYYEVVDGGLVRPHR